VSRRWTNRDLASLSVLALLSQGPRHPYQMHRFMLDTHKDFVTGLPRSIYHAVEGLVAEGFIAAEQSVRDGARPERTVYALTDEGRAELATRLRRMLEHVDPDATVLHAAISFVGCLAPHDVDLSMRARAATLQGSIVRIDAARSGLMEAGLPRLLLLELEWDRARTAAEFAWVNGLLDELQSGALSWSPASEQRTPPAGDGSTAMGLADP
jgi:DNA-binding PadR family transcriptional regulator